VPDGQRLTPALASNRPPPAGSSSGQDIGVDDSLAQLGPRIAVSLVRADAGLDVVIDRSDDFAADPMFGQGIKKLPQEFLG